MSIKSRVISSLATILSVVFLMAAGGRNEIGAVALVDGEVWKVAKQGKGKKEFIDSASTIFEGDQIITSEEGYIKILMNDDTVFDLGGASKFTFEKFKMKTKKDRKAKYNLGYGQMRSIFTVKSKDEKSLQIKTPDVVMGIRGTEFLTQYAGKTQVVLLEGKLNIKSLGVAKMISMKPGNMFDSAKINTKNLQASLSKIGNVKMNKLQIKNITDRGSFISNVMSKEKKFPVSKEMKKEMNSKPAEKVKQQMKEATVIEKGQQKKNDVQTRVNTTNQKQAMRAQFTKKMDAIKQHREEILIKRAGTEVLSAPTQTTAGDQDSANQNEPGVQ